MNKIYKFGPFIVLGIFIFVILGYVNNLDIRDGLIGLSPTQTDFPFPVDCTNSSIGAFWNQVFVDDFTGVNYVNASNYQTPDWDWEVCTSFFAYEEDGSRIRILFGSYTPNSLFNYDAIDASVTQAYLDLMSERNPSEEVIDNIGSLLLLDTIFLNTRDVQISSVEEADSAYDNYFTVVKSGDFQEDTGVTVIGEENYFYISPIETEGININENSVIGSIKDYGSLSYTEENDCFASFTPVNTSCSGGSLTTWFNDTNSCESVLFRPLNQTYDCVVEGDEEIYTVEGNFTAFEETYSQLSILVDGSSFNFGENYSDEIKKFKIVESSKTLIEFDYDFGEEGNFSLDDLEFIQNNDSDVFGFIIINGLHVNKTARVKRLAEGNAVCIKDSNVNSINEISSGCNSTQEFILECPGSGNKYACSINSQDYFVISGLKNSAVREFDIPETFDSNNQNEDSLFGGVNDVTSCTPRWSCASWEDCVNGNQTRSCTDDNSCGVNTNKPLETQTCKIETNLWIWLVVGGSVILFLLIIGVIIVLIIKNKDNEFQQSTQVVMQTNQNIQPRFNPI